jgi:hypothetical protein
LIFATDYDDDNIYFYQAITTAPAYPGGYNWITPGMVSMPGVGSYKSFSFLSRDEASTTHTSGDADNPLHNLGYLHSTASHPARTYYYDTNDWVIKDVAPNLKYLDFDAFGIPLSDALTMLLFPSKCREIFNQRLTPSWQWQIRYLDIFANTEGGAIPSTIEAAAPYTPINTSNFDKNLNSTVNNLQAFADRVDELDTGPSIHAATEITSPAEDDEVPVVDVSLATPSVKRLTWANLRSKVLSLSLFLTSEGSHTISGGDISITTSGSRVLVDTEGGAASDNLTSITGGTVGQIIVLRTVSSARDVTVVDGGTLYLAGSNFVLANVYCVLTMMCITPDSWIEISRSSN